MVRKSVTFDIWVKLGLLSETILKNPKIVKYEIWAGLLYKNIKIHNLKYQQVYLHTLKIIYCKITSWSEKMENWVRASLHRNSPPIWIVLPTMVFFYRDEPNTSIFSIKYAVLEITIFFSFLPNLLIWWCRQPQLIFTITHISNIFFVA
jgi:hypothetical protein